MMEKSWTQGIIAECRMMQESLSVGLASKLEEASNKTPREGYSRIKECVYEASEVGGWAWHASDLGKNHWEGAQEPKGLSVFKLISLLFQSYVEGNLEE